MVNTQAFDLVVIGAGAAGLMCAMTAGARGRRVLLLEHTEKIGKKILISGGGRCNFTNLEIAPDRFLSANPHFCKSALSRYTQHDFIELVERHQIAYHEKTLGQLFCDGSSRQVVAMLEAECEAVGVEIRIDCRVTDVSRSDRFHITTTTEEIEAQAVVLATGSLSIPKMGATGFSHRIARQFGLGITETRPALVPFTFEGDDLTLMQDLRGVSLPCIARCDRAAFQEAMLFTHRGLSGPAILQASTYWREGMAIELDLLPGTNAAALLGEAKIERARSNPASVLAEHLPQRLAQALAEGSLRPGNMADQRGRDLEELGALLNGWRLKPSGTEGYAKAEVTLGGVDTAALSSKTMEAKAVPGLYVIGEAIDVTGWLGGYNFQWAWSSGWAAGMAA
ncbi:MAG: NAD(P)/FAD-dependent oxidoreductase [Alphaproteobacteria bacterium]|nr:NAD(P)/FAD-dependent oxidoreductase [Alphaproteobacteria bacterium]